MITLSNPRTDAVIENYPIGGSGRGPCHFWLESHPKRGHRFMRQTTGKPKAATFGGQGCIVDGSDGRTYLLQFAGVCDFIHVRSSDFMSSEAVGKSSVFPDDPQYEELKRLILEANRHHEQTT